MNCALGRLGMLDYQHSELPMSCGDILKIDPTGKTTLGHFDTAYFDLWNYREFFSYHPYEAFGDNDYEEELLEYGKPFGLTREDVDLLLQSGYDFYGIGRIALLPDTVSIMLRRV